MVASQIQKLAEQSNESASQIDDITSALIKDSTRAVETMQQVRNIMDEQSDKMTQTDQMFHQVNNGVANALESVVHITGKTENLDDSREKVVDVVKTFLRSQRRTLQAARRHPLPWQRLPTLYRIFPRMRHCLKRLHMDWIRV